MSDTMIWLSAYGSGICAALLICGIHTVIERIYGKV